MDKSLIVKLDGINVGEAGQAWVSFEYLQEKEASIRKLLNCITWDITHD